MFTIYEIPGVKVGCTSNLTHRMKEQGFDEYKVLEEWEDAETASRRELELQKELGYRVDNSDYITSIQNRREGGRKSMTNNWSNPKFRKSMKDVSSNNMKKLKSDPEFKRRHSEIASKVVGIRNNIEHACPHCGVTGKGPSMMRYHFGNCLKSPELTDEVKQKRQRKELQCPHCQKVGKGGNMKRYHFDNCKYKGNI